MEYIEFLIRKQMNKKMKRRKSCMPLVGMPRAIQKTTHGKETLHIKIVHYIPGYPMMQTWPNSSGLSIKAELKYCPDLWESFQHARFQLRRLNWHLSRVKHETIVLNMASLVVTLSYVVLVLSTAPDLKENLSLPLLFPPRGRLSFDRIEPFVLNTISFPLCPFCPQIIPWHYSHYTTCHSYYALYS